MTIRILGVLALSACVYLPSKVYTGKGSVDFELEVPQGADTLEISAAVDPDHASRVAYLDCTLTMCVASSCLKSKVHRVNTINDSTQWYWVIDVHNVREVTCNPWVDANDDLKVHWKFSIPG